MIILIKNLLINEERKKESKKSHTRTINTRRDRVLQCSFTRVYHVRNHYRQSQQIYSF